MRLCFRKRSSNFYHANERFLRLLLSPPLDKAHLAAPPLSSTADNAGENVLVQVKAQLKVHPDGAGAEKKDRVCFYVICEIDSRMMALGTAIAQKCFIPANKFVTSMRLEACAPSSKTSSRSKVLADSATNTRHGV